jgi:hypothetical protein
MLNTSNAVRNDIESKRNLKVPTRSACIKQALDRKAVEVEL